MNARNLMWYTNIFTANERGQIFEEIIVEQHLSILNNHKPTHYHVQTDTYSTVDLSLCSTDCVLDFDYDVSDTLHDSDHYPIYIEFRYQPIVLDKLERFRVEKADWPTFHRLTQTNLTDLTLDIVDDMAQIINEIISAAHNSISRSSNSMTELPVPWFNDECKEAIKLRYRADRALTRNHILENKISYNKSKTRFWYTCK